MRNLWKLLLLASAASLLVGGPTPGLAAETTVLVEAESFEQLGGWVVDQQFMDQMGSPLLMAHGLGEPVEDAATTVELPAAGVYRVFARTRDWVAPWKAPGAPGRFQLWIDGKTLAATFGTEGAAWRWQYGGAVEILNPKVRVALHDLTGFNGRCDAILFTTDKTLQPADGGDELARLRRRLLQLPDEPEDAGRFDLVVVGGGIAGECTAIAAARLGLETALIQNRPVLGGNNSSEVRVHLVGLIHLPPYRALGGLVRELDPGPAPNAAPAEEYDDAKKLQLARSEKKLHLFLDTHVFRVEMDGGRIAAVIAENVRSNRELRFSAPLFADCTGDGNLGCLAGADYRYGRESREETAEPLAPEKSDQLTMGSSVMWYSVETETPTAFPDCPWAIQFNENNYQKALKGDWNWETGFDRDQIQDFEYVRDHGLRAVFGNWSFQKNHATDKEQYARYKLAWAAYVAGKRESRRLLGDVILQQQDIEQQRQFPDASVTATWTIDLHYPIDSDQFPGSEFRSRAEQVRIKPYAIPYRCLYSRNVPNLFMAGRNISVTHVALGTVRVQRTTGMMGEVVGMAASICRGRHTDPRDVYEKYLDELKQLMTQGVGKEPPPEVDPLTGDPKPPAWLKDAGPNLARAASVAVSGGYQAADYPASNINDGRVSYSDNRLRWVSDDKTPATVSLTWDKPQRINAVRIVTGQHGDYGPTTPITDFVLQYRDGAAYVDIAGAKATNNEQCDWREIFPAIQTTQLRLVVTATPGDLARIWELEAYHVAQEKK